MKLQIDNSAIQAYRRCPQYFFAYYVQGLRPLEAEQTAADRGSLIHEALESYYKHGTVPILEDDTLNQIVQNYIACWPKEEDYFEVLDAELRFEVALPHFSNVTLVGSIDLLAQEKGSDKVLVIDHKTTGWLHYLPNQATGSQFSCYTWACQQLGYNCWEGMINGISTNPKDLEKGQEKSFRRIPFTRTQYQIANWLRSTVLTVGKIMEDLQAYQNAGVLKFERNYGPACHAYNKPCEFFNVCHAEDDPMAQMYAENFKVDSWKNFTLEWE